MQPCRLFLQRLFAAFQQPTEARESIPNFGNSSGGFFLGFFYLSIELLDELRAVCCGCLETFSLAGTLFLRRQFEKVNLILHASDGIDHFNDQKTLRDVSEFAVVDLPVQWTYNIFGRVEEPIDAALAERVTAEQNEGSVLVSVVGSRAHWTL